MTVINQYPPAGLQVGAVAPAFGYRNHGSNPEPKVVADLTGQFPYLIEYSVSQFGERCEDIGSDKIRVGTERWWFYSLDYPSDLVVESSWMCTGQIHDAQGTLADGTQLGAIGNPLIQSALTPDGSLKAVIRPREDVNGGAETILTGNVRGHRVYVATHVKGGSFGEMWARLDAPPDVTAKAGAYQTLTWRSTDFAYGPQGFLYRGSKTPGTSVVRLCRMAYGDTLADTAEAAGWVTTVPPPPPSGLNLHELSRTTTTIKLGWTPSLPGVTGYKLIRPDGRISWSTNPAQASANFTLMDGPYRVEALSVPFSGSYQT